MGVEGGGACIAAVILHNRCAMPAVTLDSVIGHPHAAATLRRQLGDGTLAHALLISGPERIGKTTLGLALAVEILDAAAWPGGITAHPDLWLEDSDAERIGIGRVRPGASSEDGPSLQDFLSRRSYAGARRVALIGRAERMTEDAANSLLKTIEEPPAGTHIILCTSNPDGLPSTILSRCQTLSLAPVMPTALAEWLSRDHAIATDLAQSAAALAVGRPGRALRLATEPGALNAELEAVDGFLAAAGGGVTGALKAASELAPAASAEGRERALLQLGVWTSVVRDVVCVSEGVPDLIVWGAYSEAITTWAEALPRERPVAMLGAIMDAIKAIAGNAQPRLCYDVLFLDLFGGVNAPAAPATRTVTRSAGLSAAPEGSLQTRATKAKPTTRRRAK